MISQSGRTGFESHSTIELNEFIKDNRKFTKPSLSFGESEYEKAVREKSKRTQNCEFEAKKQSEVNIELLRNQHGVLEGILTELARPWYKTANGWFSFIAMTAAIVGVVLVSI
ncbi:MAG: hypothetical protein AAF340_06380 [Pseudomonadota bacterium]